MRTEGIIPPAHAVMSGDIDRPPRCESSRRSPLHSVHSIRQVDADILEQGVEEKWGAALADFDDEGRRLEAHSENVSLVDLDDDNDEDGKDFEFCGRRRGDGDGGPSPLLPGTAARMKASSSYDNLTLPAIHEQTSSCHISYHEGPDDFRSQPLHKSISESFILLNDLSELDTISSQANNEEIDHAALLQRIASGRASNRSDSFDRRKSESAQFAEAIGEEPDSLLLQKIVEDDSSSDFDDNEIDEEGMHLISEEDDQVELRDFENVLDGNPYEMNTFVGGEGVEDISNTVQEGLSRNENSSVLPISIGNDMKNPIHILVVQEEGSHNENHAALPVSLEIEIKDTSVAPCNENYVSHPEKSSIPPIINWAFTRQFSSAMNLNTDTSHRRSQSFPSSEADFFYRGIRANPPEITKRGVARGNYAQMHRKAWLEVSDKRHRYGKNLRMYYKHWEELGHPFHMFFDWLDSKGEAAGNPLPDLSEIPRSVLDSDTVLYITDPEITATYVLDIVANVVDGSATILDQDGNPVNAGKEGWIFVLRDNLFYGSQKVTAPKCSGTSSGNLSTGAVIPRQRFHHSTFFGGKAVASAGIFLTDERGLLTQLWPHSGHYRPGESHMQRVLFFLQQLGVDLSSFMVDMQQIFKVTREKVPKVQPLKEGDDTQDNVNTTMTNSKLESQEKKTKKMAKVGCLHLLSGQEVALFLAHKALMIEYGVFQQIHKIRRILPKESRDSVRFVLSFVENN